MPDFSRGIFCVLLALFSLSLAACENTIRGAAEDIQETGEAIEDSAEGNP
jgi:predicted small secreted protein